VPVFRWLKNTVIYFLARLLMGFVRCLGWNASLRFGRWAGRRAFNRAKEARKTALENLALAFPEMNPDEREELARAVFEHFGMAAAECVNIRKLKDLTTYVEMEPSSRKVMDDVLSRGRGVVYATAHCGNWELMARALARYGYPVNTIGRKSYDSRFTRLIDRFRTQGAVRTLWRGEPELLERMTAVLKRGEVMGLLIDQDTRVPGVFVLFFGKPAHTPTAASVVARKASTPMVTGFNHRLPQGGYRIVVKEFVPGDHPELEHAVLEDTQRLTARIEAHVRGHPSEWVWMHRRWKTRPPARTQPPG
jgi:KDO2-lipid IV(A) lauroyltransferase